MYTDTTKVRTSDCAIRPFDEPWDGHDPPQNTDQNNVILWASVPIPVASRSNAWVCGFSLAGIAGSNPAGSIDICLSRVLCVVRKRSLRRADLSSRGVLSSVMSKPQKWGWFSSDEKLNWILLKHNASAFTPPEMFPVLIYVRREWKIPVTTAGTETATSRLVAQCFNQLRHRVPPIKSTGLVIPDTL